MLTGKKTNVAKMSKYRFHLFQENFYPLLTHFSKYKCLSFKKISISVTFSAILVRNDAESLFYDYLKTLPN